MNTDIDPSGWRPYYTFVDHLREKCAKNEGLQGDSRLHFVLETFISSFDGYKHLISGPNVISFCI